MQRARITSSWTMLGIVATAFVLAVPHTGQVKAAESGGTCVGTPKKAEPPGNLCTIAYNWP
jgi:hypothetical protein